jgi:hypothetical protein
MGIERPVLADLSTQSERCAIGRQEKFDRSRIEANSMIQGMDLIPLVDAPDDHHANKNLKVIDVSRVTGKQWLDCEWTIRFDDDIDPGSRNIDARKLVHNLIDLHDHDAIVEGPSLDNDGGVFGVRARVEISFSIRLFRAYQDDIWNQIDE